MDNRTNTNKIEISDTRKMYSNDLFVTQLSVIFLSILTLVILLAFSPGVGVPAGGYTPEQIELLAKYSRYSQITILLWFLVLTIIMFRFIRKHWLWHKQYFIKAISAPLIFIVFILNIFLAWMLTIEI